MHDPSIEPTYYRGLKIEPIDVIRTVTEGLSGEQAFCAGNAVKYIMRAGKKGSAEQDLKKARNYLHRLATGKWLDEDGKKRPKHAHQWILSKDGELIPLRNVRISSVSGMAWDELPTFSVMAEVDQAAVDGALSDAEKSLIEKLMNGRED